MTSNTNTDNTNTDNTNTTGMTPLPMPLKGKLLVVEPKFNDQTAYKFTVSQLNNLANEITSFYKTNSRDLLTLIPNVEQVEINASGHSVLSQTTFIKQKFPGYLFYIMVSEFVTGDHSGESVAYVMSCQYESGNHEIGHLLHLQHSDTWTLQGKTWSLVKMQDGLSCMSKDPAGFLVAPQYVFLGWIPSEEILNITSLPATFKLQRISSFGSVAGVHTVAIVSELLTKNAKPLYVSYPQISKGFGPAPSVALHLEYGNSGSEKIKEFSKEYADSQFSGLNVSLVDNTDGTITVTIATI